MRALNLAVATALLLQASQPALGQAASSATSVLPSVSSTAAGTSASSPVAPSNSAPIGPGDANGGGLPCNPQRSGLDPLTHSFHSDCGYTAWCEPVYGNSSAISAGPQSQASAPAAVGVAAPVAHAALQPPGVGSGAIALHAIDHSGNVVAMPDIATFELIGSQLLEERGITADEDDEDEEEDEDEDDEDDVSEAHSPLSGQHQAIGAGKRWLMFNSTKLSELRHDSSADHLHARQVLSTSETNPADDSDSGSGNAAAHAGQAATPSSFVPPPPPTLALPSPTGLPVPTSGFCTPKGCRKDEFPFGYRGLTPPPMCGGGSYCPDNESNCLPLVPIGGVCELNRDDSCASAASSPAPGGVHIATLAQMRNSILSRRQLPANASAPQSFGGTSSGAKIQSLCLGGVCTLANAVLGGKCIIDRTQYIGYDAEGRQVADIVARDNCVDGLYCDSTSLTCLQEKPLDATCAEDRECIEYNCTDGHCEPAPETPNELKPWAFGLIGLALAISLSATVFGLYRVHQVHRAARAEEIDRYFSEQWTYRQSILSMHAAAVAAGVMTSVHTSENGDSDAGSNGDLADEKARLARRDREEELRSERGAPLSYDSLAPFAHEPFASATSILPPAESMPRLARRKPAPES